MKRVKTLTGSVYEVDENISSIRRIIGNEEPTPRQGLDGVWKKYSFIQWPEFLNVDRLLIMWEAGKYTQTSPVLSVEEFTATSN